MIAFAAQVVGVVVFMASVAFRVAVAVDRSRRRRERARARRRS